MKPVLFTVHAVVTSSDLRFDHTEVDFGHCSINESAQIAVRLTNCSLLAQEFGFVGIPKVSTILSAHTSQNSTLNKCHINDHLILHNHHTLNRNGALNKYIYTTSQKFLKSKISNVF